MRFVCLHMCPMDAEAYPLLLEFECVCICVVRCSIRYIMLDYIKSSIILISTTELKPMNKFQEQSYLASITCKVI